MSKSNKLDSNIQTDTAGRLTPCLQKTIDKTPRTTTEVISYNRANIERVEQNESRQQDRQQGRTKRREKEI